MIHVSPINGEDALGLIGDYFLKPHIYLSVDPAVKEEVGLIEVKAKIVKIIYILKR